MDTILRYAARNGSSDTHFVPGYPVRMDVRGDLVNATYRVMTTDEMDAVIEAAKGIEGPAMIKGGQALSYSYEIPEREGESLINGSFRFRVESAGCEYMANTSARTVFRYLPTLVPRLENQNPGIAQDVIDALTPTKGMVLVVGSTGTGKSTLLAGFVRYIGERRPINIMTFEEPIEFVYRREVMLREGAWLATVIQSEIGRHFQSWGDAIRSALRSAPKVALVGEMRDPESISTAVEFVRTGHCLYSTMHVDGVAAVPTEIGKRSGGDPEMWARVISVLRGVVYQRLAKTKSGGRMAVREVILIDQEARERILASKSDREAEKTMSAIIHERKTDIASEAHRLVDAGEIDPAEAERIIREAY